MFYLRRQSPRILARLDRTRRAKVEKRWEGNAPGVSEAGEDAAGVGKYRSIACRGTDPPVN